MADLNKIAEELNIKKESNIEKNLHIKTNTKRRTWLENSVTEEVSYIDTDDITNWTYHDRPENELGNIQTLADDFISIGQQQPCIARPTNIGDKFKYELIIGERRWRAAKLARIKLKVIIKDLSDNDAALAQAAENNNREDLSDFAKGMNYSRLIENNIVSQKDLIEKLGKSKQYISALLSYSKIPTEVNNAIGDMSKVTYRTAETIKRLSQKGEEYNSVLIKKAKLISSGKLGATKLSEIIMREVNSKPKEETEKNRKIVTPNGRHLFTWRKDNNNFPSIHFPKDISNLFIHKKINEKEVTDKIMQIIENELLKIE